VQPNQSPEIAMGDGDEEVNSGKEESPPEVV